MKAIGITKRPKVGQLSHELQILDVPEPHPKPNEVLVEVIASTITIDDIHLAEGTFGGGLPIQPRPLPNRPIIPGTDLAGIVKEIGSKVTRFKIGHEVFGVSSPVWRRMGTWAELCSSNEKFLMQKPDYYTFEEAAAIGLAGLVACDTVKRSAVHKGQICAVIGASGAIGSLVTEILVKKGVEVIGVCSQKNRQKVLRLGAKQVIDYKSTSFAKDICDDYPSGIDAVFDCVGGRDIEEEAMRVIKKSGTFVTTTGPERFLGDTHLGWLGVSSNLFYMFRRLFFSRLKGPKYKMANPGSGTFKNFYKMMFSKNIKPKIDEFVSLEISLLAEAVLKVSSHRTNGRVVVLLK